MQTVCHAGKRHANPKAKKPPAPALPPFVAANRAVKRAGDKGAEDRLRHDDAAENKRAATTEMNQPGKKTAPGTTQPVADQEGERDGSERGEGDRQAHRRGREAKRLQGNDDRPIEQERFLQTRDAVVGGREPLLRLEHLARGAGILSVGFVVEIAPADRREMEQRPSGQGEKGKARAGSTAARARAA